MRDDDETADVEVSSGPTLPNYSQEVNDVVAKINQPNPEADLVLDATNRALRTFVQQIGFDVLLAVVVLLAPIVFNWQSFDDIQWKVIVFAVTKTVLVTIFSFIMRRYMDKSILPTPKPPVISGDVVSPSLTGNSN